MYYAQQTFRPCIDSQDPQGYGLWHGCLDIWNKLNFREPVTEAKEFVTKVMSRPEALMYRRPYSPADKKPYLVYWKDAWQEFSDLTQ